MSLTRAKPIDRLYAEVADYELALVPDRPFARALNRHLKSPQVGHFATTPSQLVAGDRDARDDQLAFKRLSQELELPWKQTAHLIGEVLQCWEHQGSPQAIIEYPRYDTPSVHKVVNAIAGIDTRAKRLQETHLTAEDRVAVIGIDQMTTLQRSILPANVDTVDPFDDNSVAPPTFQLVKSASSMLAQVVETVRANDPQDIAVVLEEGSRYNTLVESAFEAADIPYHGGPGFTDDPNHRALLRLLRLSHAGQSLTVGDVRPVLARLGTVPPIENDNRRLDSVDEEAANWIQRILHEIPQQTIAEVIDRFERATGKSVDDFTSEAEALGLLDAPATRETIDHLTFYFQSFDIPIERDDRGVALASATAAAYVDRPLVFFLGLDQGWTREAPPRPWVDGDQFFARDLARFQLLLQSGAKQQYLVQDVAGGDPVVPCLYLHRIFDETFERFRDLADGDILHLFRQSGDGFDISIPTKSTTSYDTISQTALNTFVHSPRDYAFDRLVGSPDAIPLEEGTLLHDFAEFAVANPEFIDEDAIEQAVSSMAQALAPFYSSQELEVRRTAYHAWLRVLAAFVEQRPPEELSVTIGETADGSNHFAELFNISAESNQTERSFEAPELGLKGTIDLVHSDTHLVDFKRSNRKTATSTVKAAALDPPDDTPNFQTPQYLAYFRTQSSERRLQFSFLYLRELADEALMGEFDIDDGLTTIEYYPIPFEEYVTSETAFRALVEESYSKSRKTFEQISFEEYRQFWADQPPDALSGSLDEEPLAGELEDLLCDLVGNYKYVTKGTGQALRYLEAVRDSNFFADDLDAFETFVTHRLDELNRYLAGEERFPKRGQVEELNDRRLNHPDLLLDHD